MRLLSIYILLGVDILSIGNEKFLYKGRLCQFVCPLDSLVFDISYLDEWGCEVVVLNLIVG